MLDNLCAKHDNCRYHIETMGNVVITKDNIRFKLPRRMGSGAQEIVQPNRTAGSAPAGKITAARSMTDAASLGAINVEYRANPALQYGWISFNMNKIVSRFYMTRRGRSGAKGEM